MAMAKVVSVDHHDFVQGCVRSWLVIALKQSQTNGSSLFLANVTFHHARTLYVQRRLTWYYHTSCCTNSFNLTASNVMAYSLSLADRQLEKNASYVPSYFVFFFWKHLRERERKKEKERERESSEAWCLQSWVWSRNTPLFRPSRRRSIVVGAK